EPSLGIRLLTDLRLVFEDRGEKVFSKALIASLVALEESPWHDLKGKPIDERGLSRRLAAYGIKPKPIRMGETVSRGYQREDFIDAWRRYLPQQPSNSDTPVTSITAEMR